MRKKEDSSWRVHRQCFLQQLYSLAPASTTHQQKLGQTRRKLCQGITLNQPSPLWCKSKQGEGLREGGVEGLSLAFQVCPGEQEAGEPPADHGQEGCFQCSWQSCSCLWLLETPSSAKCPLCPPSTYPWWQGVSAHPPAEHMKLLEGHFPSTALQLFCYLSRKELTKPFDLLPNTEKEIKC